MSEISFSNHHEFFDFLLHSYHFVKESESLRQQVETFDMERTEFLEKHRSLLESFQEFVVSESLSQPVSKSVDRIYIDGCWDIMHSGHFNAIRQAKLLGKCLVVGVHSDEEISRNKGTPVMAFEERVAMVSACKWVDEVVLNAPYTPTIEWLDQNNCQYIAHGDDVAINEAGEDAYGGMKRVGRFKVIKRTEGISTTTIVGKLLLMTRESLSSLSEPVSVTNSDFLTTSRRIREFSNSGHCKPTGRVVYVDGSFDLFHIGHVETLKQAKELGDFLIVGIHDDRTVNLHKGSNYPIMHLHERVLNVLAIKYVDEVVIGAPWVIKEDLINSLNISLVVQGTISKIDSTGIRRRKQSLEIGDEEEDPYLIPKSRNMYVEVTSKRNIETCHIIQRIIDNRLKHLNKFTRNNQKESSYYSNKVYIEER